MLMYVRIAELMMCKVWKEAKRLGSCKDISPDYDSMSVNLIPYIGGRDGIQVLKLYKYFVIIEIPKYLLTNTTFRIHTMKLWDCCVHQ